MADNPPIPFETCDTKTSLRYGKYLTLWMLLFCSGYEFEFNEIAFAKKDYRYFVHFVGCFVN